MSKIDPELQHWLSANPGEIPIEVVVDLTSLAMPAVGSRAERIAQAATNFSEIWAPIAEHIELLGGEVRDTAWINSTALCRLTASQIAKLEHFDAVVAIRLNNRRIMPDP